MQYGHFDNENREYVIDRVDLPTSWTNYIGVKDMMCSIEPHSRRVYFLQITGVPQDHQVPSKRSSHGPAWTLCIFER